LPPFDINLRARDVARRWLGSLVKRDVYTWQRTSDVPFTLVDYHYLEFNKREELDQLFQKAGSGDDAEAARATFTVKDVVSVDKYLKSGMTSSRAAHGVDEAIPQLRASLSYRLFL
jgi:hypothetical protein